MERLEAKLDVFPEILERIHHLLSELGLSIDCVCAIISMHNYGMQSYRGSVCRSSMIEMEKKF